MIAAKVAMVDLVVELNLPLSTLVRINKVFKKSLRIQTLLKGQLKMFLFLVLSSSFLCLLFFFSDIRGRHVCYMSIDKTQQQKTTQKHLISCASTPHTVLLFKERQCGASLVPIVLEFFDIF